MSRVSILIPVIVYYSMVDKVSVLNSDSIYVKGKVNRKFGSCVNETLSNITSEADQ